jgi:hypothetical protein
VVRNEGVIGKANRGQLLSIRQSFRYFIIASTFTYNIHWIASIGLTAEDAITYIGCDKKTRKSTVLEIILLNNDMNKKFENIQKMPLKRMDLSCLIIDDASF